MRLPCIGQFAENIYFPACRSPYLVCLASFAAILAAQCALRVKLHGKEVSKFGRDKLCLHFFHFQVSDTQVGVHFQCLLYQGLQIRVGEKFFPRQVCDRRSGINLYFCPVKAVCRYGEFRAFVSVVNAATSQ